MMDRWIRARDMRCPEDVMQPIRALRKNTHTQQPQTAKRLEREAEDGWCFLGSMETSNTAKHASTSQRLLCGAYGMGIIERAAHTLVGTIVL